MFHLKQATAAAALMTAMGAVMPFATPAAADPIRTIELVTRPQAAQPSEFQFVQLIAQEWRKLGLDVEVNVMPWPWPGSYLQCLQRTHCAC